MPNAARGAADGEAAGVATVCGDVYGLLSTQGTYRYPGCDIVGVEENYIP